MGAASGKARWGMRWGSESETRVARFHIPMAGPLTWYQLTAVSHQASTDLKSSTVHKFCVILRYIVFYLVIYIMYITY